MSVECACGCGCLIPRVSNIKYAYGHGPKRPAAASKIPVMIKLCEKCKGQFTIYLREKVSRICPDCRGRRNQE